jgi:hypothetical protein
MEMLFKISQQLKKEFPLYNFPIYRGLFEKYIGVDIHGKISFTIWVDKNKGYKELLDEVSFYRLSWLKRIFKNRLFHWSKFRTFIRRDYHNIIFEKQQLNLPERKMIRYRLESSLSNIHIS